MISLSLPRVDEKYYVNLGGFLAGPISPAGSSGEGNAITYRHSQDTLDQGGRLFDENDVNHVQHSGEFSYLPFMSDITSTPTDTYPNAITHRNRSFSGVLVTSQVYNGGSVSNVVSPLSKSSPWNWKMIYADNQSPYNFSYFTMDYDPTLTGVISPTTTVRIVHYHYKFLKFDSTNRAFYEYGAEITSGYRQDTIYLSKFAKYWSDLKPSLLLDMFLSVGSWEYVATQTLYLTPYQSYSTPSLSVSDVKAELDMRYFSTLWNIKSPIESKNYGELALEASSKVLANQTNMIAFLKDLRKPQELIPKLWNLGNLKGLSDNFLTINYGVLPTVSDLNEIIGAFKRISPYLDRNGFSVYTAAHTDSSASGDYSFGLEQHIKLAIENEDSHLVDLVNRIDSAGFLPTFENLWDLVPYSFVIDWFIDVGGFLERVDSRLRLMRLNVQYATMSYKYTYSAIVKPSTTFPIVGTARLVRYSRWTTDHSPEPPLFSPSTPTVSNHWLEAGALLIQRAK